MKTKTYVKGVAALCALAAVACTGVQQSRGDVAVYLDESQPLEKRVEDALSRLTLEEKVGLLHAQSKFSSAGVPRLGIPEVWCTDGPHGIRPEVLWDEWDQAGWTNDSCTAFPALTCLAATWNPEMSALYGKSIGEEARYRDKDVLLGPGVNIYRTPLNGRNFEYMGEDPFLSARMVVPYVQGVQQNGVAACVKHFAVNNQELRRHEVDVVVDDRALHEIYLPAFKAAVQEGGAWAIMGAYNKYKGEHCCHNQYLLNDILKRDWAFDGVVISDWGGVHDTREAIFKGLDMEFGTWTDGLNWGATNAYGNYYLANPYLELLRKGEVGTGELDDKARRVLRLIFRTAMNSRKPFGSLCSPEHNAAARRIAGEGMVLLKNDDRRAIDMGLKYVNNDACFPSITVVGQLMEAVTSGRYDTDHLALMMTQTGGCCRASNYVGFIRRALEKAGYGHIPVVSVNLNGMEKNEGFTLSKGLIMDAVHALVYGDLFMRCLYHVRPYELEKGSAEAIHQKWKEICVDSLVNPKTKWRYADVCRGIVADFDALPIDETLRKPCVGIVGEILVKYMPLANNHLVELLEAEGAEAVVPDLLDFFNYSIYGRDFRHKNLGTSWKDSVVAKAGVEMLRRLRAPALEALEKSRRFEAPMPIEDVAKLAEPFLAIGNQYGEGWFLTGEMAELLTSGTPNIVCIQPFACLPNHVVGKGVIKALRKSYPWANIVAVDYDPGASEVNQLNRIKLMLSSARRAMHSGAAQDAEALPIAR